MTAQLIALSSPSPAELETSTDVLADRLETSSDLTALARCLQTQPPDRHRRVMVAAEGADAARVLRERDPKRIFTAEAVPGRPVVFMFSGVGDQYPGMAAGLYENLPPFRHALDRCFELLDMDLRTALYPEKADEPTKPGLAALFDQRASTQEIHRTVVAQPLAFATQYAMAQALGLTPSALLGYSVGEYVAACLAGVFSLDDALNLVALRARLVADLPEGAMLAVMSGPDAIEPLLEPPLSVAALNGPELTVLAGPADAIERIGKRLLAQDIASRRLSTSHAFHSPMMDPVVEPLHDLLVTLPLRPPTVPFLSNATGTWINEQEATSPRYWADHLRLPIRFTEQLAEVWKLPDPVLVELGPGGTLTNLAVRHPSRPPEGMALRTLPGLFESQPDIEAFLTTVGRLWTTGAEIPWPT
ncbi:acyltransferase domain-containing protein [Spirillospora sp. CA-294931]|uniref:acyltransferase domain-containing protein n=1 Tax=Spirillospora sp. CA-294931 TaxID=3240042 RepID=UPI003D928513